MTLSGRVRQWGDVLPLLACFRARLLRYRHRPVSLVMVGWSLFIPFTALAEMEMKPLYKKVRRPLRSVPPIRFFLNESPKKRRRSLNATSGDHIVVIFKIGIIIEI